MRGMGKEGSFIQAGYCGIKEGLQMETGKGKVRITERLERSFIQAGLQTDSP